MLERTKVLFEFVQTGADRKDTAASESADQRFLASLGGRLLAATSADVGRIVDLIVNEISDAASESERELIRPDRDALLISYFIGMNGLYTAHLDASGTPAVRFRQIDPARLTVWCTSLRDQIAGERSFGRAVCIPASLYALLLGDAPAVRAKKRLLYGLTDRCR